MKRLRIAAAMFGMTVPAAASADANSDPATVTVAVHYGDLDMRSKAGRTALERRMSAAVRQICEDPETRDLERIMEIRSCFKDARKTSAGLVQQVVDRDGINANMVGR